MGLLSRGYLLKWIDLSFVFQDLTWLEKLKEREMTSPVSINLNVHYIKQQPYTHTRICFIAVELNTLHGAAWMNLRSMIVRKKANLRRLHTV